MRSRTKVQHPGWGVLWRTTDESIDGETQTLIGCANIGRELSFGAYRMAAFSTRQHAQAFIKEKYGYIAKRRDLRIAPHGWRMPKPVRIQITVELEKPQVPS